MEKKDKKNKILKGSVLVGLFLLVFGLSYALFQITLNGAKKVKIKTGKLELQLLDKNNNPIYTTGGDTTTSYEINLDNQVPVSDEVGLDSTAFEFKLKNSGNIKTSYTIYLDDVALEDGESRIDDSYVKYALTKNGTESSPALVSTMGENPNRELDKGIISTAPTTNEYILKIWIDHDATNEAMDKVFHATLRIVGTQYVQTGPFEDGTFAATLYKKSQVKTLASPVPNGFNSADEETAGLYQYTDSTDTTTYVYRGNVENNYVTFAEQNWRVLRIQEDGTVKLMRSDAIDYINTTYDYGNATYSDLTYRTVKYHKSGYSEAYGSSNVRSYVIAWYNDTMSDYDNDVVTNEYCSDRTSNSYSYGAKNIWTRLDPLYGAYNRISLSNSNKYQWTVKIKCSYDKINAKAALISMDEYILAGGIGYNDNKPIYSTYVNKPYEYWTMSPAGFYNVARITYSKPDGYLTYNSAAMNYGVIPVITLRADISPSSGDGSEAHPYVIS